jgi:archaellum component FlaC
MMPDDAPRDPNAPISDEMKEITASFAVVMKFIAEQRLEIETLKACVKFLGVTAEELSAVQAELKRRWDEKGDALIDAIKQRRSAAALRKLLESATGPEQ